MEGVVLRFELAEGAEEVREVRFVSVGDDVDVECGPAGFLAPAAQPPIATKRTSCLAKIERTAMGSYVFVVTAQSETSLSLSKRAA